MSIQGLGSRWAMQVKSHKIEHNFEWIMLNVYFNSYFLDFYPNGGRVQTGCSNIFVGAVTDFIWCKHLCCFQI